LVEKQRLRRDVRQVALLYAERERKSGLREAAVRTEAARLGAVLAGEWIVEKARQEAEAKAVLEAEKAASEKAAAEKAAAEKAAKIAAESAAKAEAEAQALDAPVPSDPNRSGQNLEDVFKSLDFDTTR
jgi:colicin import membrane protein